MGSRAFLTDALGSTLGLADSTGVVQSQYSYDPFGNDSLSGANTTNSFEYTGRELDATGLQFNRVFRVADWYGVTAAVAIRDGVSDQYKHGSETACREELWLQLTVAQTQSGLLPQSLPVQS